MGYKIIGFLEDNKPKTQCVSRYPILGGFGDLEKVVQETNVESVLIAAPGLSQSALSDLIYRAQFFSERRGCHPESGGGADVQHRSGVFFRCQNHGAPYQK